MAPDTPFKPNINDYKMIEGREFIRQPHGWWLHVSQKSGETQQEAQERETNDK